MRKWTLVLALIITTYNMAQSEDILPYYEIPEHADSYTAGTVASRMLDGLGFRYYWATEGLREEDLEYKPSESGRTSAETIDHLLGLSNFILNSISTEKSSDRDETLTFDEKRKQTV